MPRAALAAGAAAVLSTTCLRSNAAGATGGLTGFGQAPVVADRTQLGFRQLYETNLFVSLPGNSAVAGPSRRLGAPPGEAPRGDGYFRVDGLPAPGNVSLLVSQPVFWIRPKVVGSVPVPPGGVATVNVTLTPDYAMERRDNQQWTAPGACWHQTFLCTGTALSGVSFVLAGFAPSATAVTAELLAEAPGVANVSAWPPARAGGAKTTGYKLGTNTDMWLRWRSDEVPLKRNATYALRLCGVGGDIQPYLRRKDAGSYPHGSAYDASGAPKPFDINAVVFTDNDGTRVTLSRRRPGTGDIRDAFWGKAWAQTFTAGGSSLAAVDAVLVGANNDWNVTVRWSVREGGSPTGAAVGPTKVTRAAFQAAGYGLHGVSFGRGEVPLTPGRVYAVVFEVVDPPPDSDGFNPAVSNDGYSGGHGWQSVDGKSWAPHEGVTLCATVVEWQ